MFQFISTFSSLIDEMHAVKKIIFSAFVIIDQEIPYINCKLTFKVLQTMATRQCC